MKVLVTGGAGFIGSHIVDALCQRGDDVVVVDLLTGGRQENLSRHAVLYREDITSQALDCIFERERPEAVIHQAAQIDVRRSVDDPVGDAHTNILGSIRLLEACRRFRVRKIVYASSAAAYGDPLTVPVKEDHPALATSPYGLSKYLTEHYLRLYRDLYGIEYTVLRYANVYGPRQDPLGEGGVIAVFAHRIARGLGVSIYGDGRQTRDFVYVDDVVRANICALTNPLSDGATINVSHGREMSINELVGVFSELVGRSIDVTYEPERPGEVSRSSLCNQRAWDILGWKPTVDIRSGLRRVLDWESHKGR